MHRKYFFAILALTLLCLLLILIFFFGLKPSQEEQQGVQPLASPFRSSISGVGIVEPMSGNIYLGIPFDSIVKQVNVSVNDQVKKGDLLLQLDHQALLANLLVKQKEYEKALANLNQLKSLPRPEDLIVAEEALKRVQTSFNESKKQYEMVVNLPNLSAISKEEQDRRLFKYQQAEAELKENQARFEKVKSGAWEPELKIALYEVEQAQAGIAVVEAEIQQRFIKSPIDGTILQMKIHEGETTHSDPSKTGIIVGNLDELYLRVSIDQLDAPNFTPKASSVAYRQGDYSQEFPLEFIHIEPLMVPKKYLTNAVSDQVDAHVFEVLYRIAKKDPGLFIGEQMNVFIQTEKK